MNFGPNYSFAVDGFRSPSRVSSLRVTREYFGSSCWLRSVHRSLASLLSKTLWFSLDLGKLQWNCLSFEP